MAGAVIQVAAGSCILLFVNQAVERLEAIVDVLP
jgi:hypothetical protein